jgi:hypothetical protein
MKLYDIVIVDRGDFRHYGEILSRRTPTDTFMVRMVPGHSGTLLEVPATTLQATDVRLRWVHYAQVSGPGAFPVDMLRRDHAAPLNFNLDTLEIVPNFGFDNKLIIATASAHRKPIWNYMRWQSFGWRCCHEVTTPFEGSSCTD